jgi:hypothetical protein
VNSPSWVNGKIGSYALEFNYEDKDHVNLGTQIPYLNTEFTVSVWLNPDAINNGNLGPVVDLRRNNAIILRQNGDGKFYWYHAATDGTFDSVSTSVSNGTWYHAVLTWDGSTTTAYLDGSVVGTISNSSHDQKNNADASIGGQNEITSAGDEYFDGTIDDVRIYDRALSQPEIQALYQRTKTQKITDKDRLTAGLVGHWPLNEDNTSNAYDLSGRGNDSSSVTGTTTTAGLGGTKARSFDGSDDYVEINSPAGGTLNPDKITVSAWIYSRTDQKNGIVNKNDGGMSGGNKVYQIINDGSSNWRFQVWDSASTVFYYSHSNPTFNEWTHLALTYDKSNLKGYVNGSEVGSVSTDGNPLLDDDAPLWIGQHYDTSSGWNFDGRIADVRIYNRALSASEIQTLYDMGGGA